MTSPATVAVFDLDGTLTRGDTYLAYLRLVLRRRSHRLAYCAGLPGACVRFKLGALSNGELKRRFLAAILAGCHRSQIEAYTLAFVELCMARMIKPAGVACIERHRQGGHRLILASASLDLYVNAIGARLGFDEVICTRAAWAADLLADRFDGPNLRGTEKLAALKAVLPREAQAPPHIFAYSDHHSDLPLLLFADRGIAVDPTRALAAAASAHGLPIERWGRMR